MKPHPSRSSRLRARLAAACLALLGGAATAADPQAAVPPAPAKATPTVKPPTYAADHAHITATPKDDARAVAEQIRSALGQRKDNPVKLVVTDPAQERAAAARAAPPRTAHPAVHRQAPHNDSAVARAQAAANGRALPMAHPAAAASAHAPVHPAPHAAPKKAHDKAKAHHGHSAHWDYGGPTGPEHWGAMKPEYGTCATGQRQSPVHIQEQSTLQGPADALRFNYHPSGGSVINNGHTIQVDVEGENTLTVRGSTYTLLQFHFHHPAEEKINQKGFAMVAHLVHKNEQGQLGVVAVLIDPGEANSFIHKVWTHMPLDVNDRVKLPAGLLDLRELLPQDPRYYMLMGSLTTPPCTEGVLWMVLRQPVTVSREQLRLFSQLFPMNARPIQALNGRVVREGM